MIESSRLRFVWFGVVAALLVLGLAGPIQRSIATRSKPASSADAHRQQLRQEFDALRDEFMRDRATIINRVRSLQRADHHDTAMNLAARFYPLQDPEMNALYQISASAEGQRQRLAEYRDLVARECTDTAARTHVIEYLRLGRKPEERSEISAITQLALTRLSGSAIRADVVKRLQEPIEVTDAPGHETEHHDHAAAAHRAHVHPDFVAALLRGTAAYDELLCVWGGDGQRTWADGSRHFELLLLLAPSASGKRLEPEVFLYAERPHQSAAATVSD
ncbi:MAG: hypothetical protein P9E24_01170 [Candidatus Competibacter sp.]|nr:hypothetical protein [Candidatus Competibacter sp.]MDG4583813.1 hypothetical protein [Candidatus Competibacter sp.]